MPTVEFYSSLEYDFSKYENEVELLGLTIRGFDGQDPLHVNNFDELALKATRDVISMYFSPINTINKSYSSYGLKHIVEDFLRVETRGKIDYINNGTLILAMYDAGFRIKREDSSSPNCFFNVSKTGINSLRKRLAESNK